MRNIIATGDVHQRLASLPPRLRFFSLVRRELEFSPELYTVGLGSGAKANGVKLGRKFKMMLHQRNEALARKESGKESQTEIARSYNVSHSTISRLSA